MHRGTLDGQPGPYHDSVAGHSQDTDHSNHAQHQQHQQQQHHQHQQQQMSQQANDSHDSSDAPRKERMNSAQPTPTFQDPYARNAAGMQHWRSVTDNSRPLRSAQHSPPRISELMSMGNGDRGGAGGQQQYQQQQQQQHGAPSGGPLDVPFTLSPSLRFDRSRSSASDRASATSGVNDTASSFGLTNDHMSSRSIISPPPALSAIHDYLPHHPHHQPPSQQQLAHGNGPHQSPYQQQQHGADGPNGSGNDAQRYQLVPQMSTLSGIPDANQLVAHLDRGMTLGFKLPAAALADKAQLNRMSGPVPGPQLPQNFPAGFTLPEGERRSIPGRPPSTGPGWTEGQFARINPADFHHPENLHLHGVIAGLPTANQPRQLNSNPAMHAGATTMGPTQAAGANSEFSIFVGDLSPDLREEDLVNQFLQPPPWPPSHPFAIVHAHAQQAQGNYNPPGRIGPAPFLSTKSAKIMTDPVTGMSRGFGFVRFTHEADCARALVEMQGVVISPSNGLSPGRPLRVCTATPKNRNPNPGSPFPEADANQNFFSGAGPLGNFGPGFGALGNRPQPHPAHAGQQGMHGGPQLPPLQMPSLGNPSGIPRPMGQLPGPDALRAMSPAGGQPPAGILQAQGFGPGRNSGGLDRAPAGLTQALSQLTMPPPPPPPAAAGGPNGYPPQLNSPSSALGPNNSASASSLLLSSSSALDPNNTTVFVGGLSSLISEETLKTFFVPFGEITYVKIPPGKGCGFVQFVRKSDAERAIERMQGFPIGGGRIRLSWGRSQGDKAAAAAAQAAAQAAQLGQLAGLAGLSGLSATQLAQLAGLSSALSAVQRSAAAGNNFAGNSDANSALLQQIAASLREPSPPASNAIPTSPQPSQQHGYSFQHHASPQPPPQQHASLPMGTPQHLGPTLGGGLKSSSPPGSLDLNALAMLSDPQHQQQLNTILSSLRKQAENGNGHAGNGIVSSGPGPAKGNANGNGNGYEALSATLAKMSIDPNVLSRLRDGHGAPQEYGGSSSQQSNASGGRPSPVSNFLKSSTFSPFSPAISPVVGGGAQLHPEDGTVNSGQSQGMSGYDARGHQQQQQQHEQQSHQQQQQSRPDRHNFDRDQDGGPDGGLSFDSVRNGGQGSFDFSGGFGARPNGDSF